MFLVFFCGGHNNVSPGLVPTHTVQNDRIQYICRKIGGKHTQKPKNNIMTRDNEGDEGTEKERKNIRRRGQGVR